MLHPAFICSISAVYEAAQRDMQKKSRPIQGEIVFDQYQIQPNRRTMMIHWATL